MLIVGLLRRKRNSSLLFEYAFDPAALANRCLDAIDDDDDAAILAILRHIEARRRTLREARELQEKENVKENEK